MKIRTGFVSNSSSSSFICDICEKENDYIDNMHLDADVVICENQHRFHYKCGSKVLIDKVEPIFNKFKEECAVGVMDWEDFYCKVDETFGMIEEGLCPICSIYKLSEYEMAKYYWKENGREQAAKVHKEIKNKFKTYKAFKQYLDK